MPDENTDVVIIGSGFAGLAAACCLAQQGLQVTVLEKNSQAGGRARTWREGPYTWDMGPSWYWMPEVFEQFFARFDRQVSDCYELRRLDPSYRMIFGPEVGYDLPADRGELDALFERIEPGASRALADFLRSAEYQYRVGMGEFVFKPSLSPMEFLDARLVTKAVQLQLFSSLERQVRRRFAHPHLRSILEFPVLFLGATARTIPAMYSLMNYADLVLGTWYPMGGMHRIIEAMVDLARSLGVTFHFDEEVSRIRVEGRRATGVESPRGITRARYVVANADYHHVEQELLPARHRVHSERYWQRRTMSPSSLLYYVATDVALPNLLHHNLFFDEDLDRHAREIYVDPSWPSRPLFYVNCPTRTDPSLAPAGHEALMILIPVAPGLADPQEVRDRYFDVVMDRLERITGHAIRDHIQVRRSYAHRDFVADYHAFVGNAYGMANTLNQTAIFKPALRSRKVPNLLYTGQLTSPGPGMPPALISGQVVAKLITDRVDCAAPRPRGGGGWLGRFRR
jgi:phytoene desaturase